MDLVNQIIYLDGKRLVNSDNFGTKFGFGIQAYGNMRLFNSNYFKAIANIGYVQLESKYPFSDGFSYGVRLNIFSIGAGLQINPLGIHKFYPSFIGMLRFSEIGGESYHWTGFDYLIVSPRFGYSYGVLFNLKISKKVGFSLGTLFNYDNVWNKSNSGVKVIDPLGHVTNFYDAEGNLTGLIHDRRIAYLTLQTGVNIYFK